MIERSWCRRPVHVQPWAWKANMEIRKTQEFQASHWLSSCETRDSDWLIDGWCSRWLALYPPLLCGHFLHCGHLCDPGLLRMLWSDQVVIFKGEPQNEKNVRKLGKFPVKGVISIKTFIWSGELVQSKYEIWKGYNDKKSEMLKTEWGGCQMKKYLIYNFFCSESLPQAIKITTLVKKTTWPFVKVDQFVKAISSKLVSSFVVKTNQIYAVNFYICDLNSTKVGDSRSKPCPRKRKRHCWASPALSLTTGGCPMKPCERSTRTLRNYPWKSKKHCHPKWGRWREYQKPKSR